MSILRSMLNMLLDLICPIRKRRRKERDGFQENSFSQTSEKTKDTENK